MDNVRISRNNGANYRKLATAFVPKTLFEKARCGVARRGGRGEGHCSLFQANAGERSLTEGASVSIAMETMKGIYVSFLFQRGGRREKSGNGDGGNGSRKYRSRVGALWLIGFFNDVIFVSRISTPKWRDISLPLKSSSFELFICS